MVQCYRGLLPFLAVQEAQVDLRSLPRHFGLFVLLVFLFLLLVPIVKLLRRTGIDHGSDTNFTIFRNPVFSSIPHPRSRLKASMKSVEILEKELAEAKAQEVEAFKEFRRDSNPGAEKEWLNVMENRQRLAEELSRRKRLGNTKVN